MINENIQKVKFLALFCIFRCYIFSQKVIVDVATNHITLLTLLTLLIRITSAIRCSKTRPRQPWTRRLYAWWRRAASILLKSAKNADTYEKLRILLIYGSKSCYKHIFHCLDVKSGWYVDEIGKNISENQWRPRVLTQKKNQVNGEDDCEMTFLPLH